MVQATKHENRSTAIAARESATASGGIESTIRRVVHRRLKGSGTFWLAEGAESMLQLRAIVVSKRWDETISARNRMHCQTLPNTPGQLAMNSVLQCGR